MEFLTILLTSDYIKMAIPFFLLAIATESFLSWWWSKGLYRVNDTINSLSCGIFQQFLDLLIRGFTLLPYIIVQKHFGLIAFSSLGLWGQLVSGVILFFAVDLCYYLFHRSSHGTNIGWAMHVVHHQSEEYNLSTALRQGMLQSFYSLWFYLPLALIGFPSVWFISLLSANTTYQFWVHTRIIGKMPAWFEAVFNTPSHHRVHHGKNPEYIDRNHAGVFIIWDKLFGTFTPEKAPPVYGITVPLRSWNPLWAQFHYLAELGVLAWRAPHWADKWRIWWKPPGWRPQGLTDDSKHNYEGVYNPRINWFDKFVALVLFGIGLGFAVIIVLTSILTPFGRSIIALSAVTCLVAAGKVCERSLGISLRAYLYRIIK
jgi:alkylglycerol monooxygenase